MKRFDGQQLLREAQRAVAALGAEETPILHIPEATLVSGGTGTLEIVEYCVDETGILVLPAGQLSTLS